MNTFDLNDFSPIPQHILDAEAEAEYAQAKIEADQKIHNVMRFIKANPGWSTRQVVEKFKLDWSLQKEFGNGIAKIAFYTDESCRFLVMEIHDLTSNWFRC